MKSVVLEIKENKAAVLDDNGIVHAVKNRDYKVGQVLELTEFELGRDEIKGRGSGHLSAFSRTAAAVLAVVSAAGFDPHAGRSNADMNRSDDFIEGPPFLNG